MTEQEAIKEIKRWTSILMSAGSQCVMETAEAQNMAINALEKLIAKKPVNKGFKSDLFGKIAHYICPNCTRQVSSVHYCPNCGQKLDWSEM